MDRSGVLDHRSGRLAIQLLKITGSSFERFAHYTTLPETVDRPLFVYLDVWWRHIAFERRVVSARVRDSVAATFDVFVSKSIQHLVDEMGRRLLSDNAELAQIAFEAENRLWDTARVSRSPTSA